MLGGRLQGAAAGAVRLGAGSCLVGLTVATIGIGVFEVQPMAAVGLFFYGVGTGVWDVAMNVDGAAVERHLGRTIMPRFHAGFSFGTIAGSGLGVPMAALHVPLEVHVTAVAVFSLAAVLVAARYFLPPPPEEEVARPARSAWLDLRPSTALRWGNRPKRAIMRQCARAKAKFFGDARK